MQVDAVKATVDTKVGTAKSRVDEVKDRAMGKWGELEEAFDKRLSNAISRLGVPSRNEVKALNAKVESLTKQIEQLTGVSVKSVKPAAKPAAKAAAKPLSKTVAKPAAKAAAKPVTKAAAKPAVKPTGKPAAAKKPVVKKPAAAKPVTAKPAAAKPAAPETSTAPAPTSASAAAPAAPVTPVSQS
jgi:hypothetical protein